MQKCLKPSDMSLQTTLCPKKCHALLFLYLHEILTDFQNSFTSILS